MILKQIQLDKQNFFYNARKERGGGMETKCFIEIIINTFDITNSEKNKYKDRKRKSQL